MTGFYQTNLLNVAGSYLKTLNIPLTETSFIETLTENPYYPSLFALSNTLERFHIPNTAFRVDNREFHKLKPPFVAYVKNQKTGKDFVLVNAVSEKEVEYIVEKKAVQVSIENFLENWDNIILKANPIEKSGEKDFLINRKIEQKKSNKLKSLFAISILLFGIILFYFYKSVPLTSQVSAFGLLIIKLIGLGVSILLLIYELDKSNAFVKRICSTGKSANCEAVLGSKASKIFGMSWSEAGFFYFSSTVLFLLSPGISFDNKIAVLAFANCLAAPYILFSVYYQWRVVKQWCPLCLTIQAVLFLELIWSLFNFWQYPYTISGLFSIILTVIFSLLLPITVWYLLKPLMIKAKMEPVYKSSYKRLLYNPETFNYFLQQQNSAPDGFQGLGIEIGNPDAENTIIKVCNPYCGPCTEAHELLDEILELNDQIKLKIIFIATNGDKDPRGVISRHLLALNNNYERTKMKLILDDWYLNPKKDYTQFATKYKLPDEELLKQKDMINEMREWVKKAEITGTPVIFLNGKRLPENYNLSELKYLV